MSTRLIGPLTGVLFVALTIVAFAISGETPDVDDPARKVVSFYTDNDSEQQIAGAVLALACIALLFFLGHLRAALRPSAGGERALVTAMLLGGLMIVVGAAIFAGLTFTLGDAADDLPADAVLALHALNSDMFFPLAIGTATFNLGLGLTVLRHGGLPRALGWLALVVGIAGATPAGFFAFLATGIVLVWASIVLAMAEAAAAPPPQPVTGG
jgi:hypothetical protein